MARQPEKKDRPNTRFHGRVEGTEAICAEPGCDAPGEFRAPYRGDEWAVGDRPRPYRLLCLDHVREFNAGYNFFSGMSPDEIHDAQRPFGGWAETRAFSGNGGADRPPRWADFSDPLDAIGARFRGRPVEAERADGRFLSGDDRKALKTLGLELDVDRMGLRKRYSELVRKFHPDRNGGDRSFEKALQDVIAAYQQLKGSPAFA
ncbi:J domain-containing protein [soil metagenome]